MGNHLVRRGGIWWARLAVPVSLRNTAGRREFVQSCRTHELAIAKIVCAVLLARWRTQLLQLQSYPMTLDVLKLVGGSPILLGSGQVPLSKAVDLSGISQDQLLRAAADGTLGLFCRIPQTQGHVVRYEDLEPISHEAGLAGGIVIPEPQAMPFSAQEVTRGGALSVYDSSNVATGVLAGGLMSATILAFDMPDQPGKIFVPNSPMVLKIDYFEVQVTQVEALRSSMAATVSPGAINHARELEKAAHRGLSVFAGKHARKLFSEAVEAYVKAPSGLPQHLASASERSQRKKGLLLFSEFMGDMPLGKIDADKLREFRDGPLRTLPAKANNLPKALKRDSMKETVETLKVSGDVWPLMSQNMQHERMLWLSRLFAWLKSQEWLKTNPAAAVSGESVLTKAERKVLARTAPLDDEGRAPFDQVELDKIFSVTHYKTGRGDHVKKNEVWYPFQYWLPLLGLYAGVRIKEASQLHLIDVKKIDDIWLLDINEATADKSLKNAFSKRQVPLHKNLVELGFIDYCDKLRANEFQRVFPDLTYSKSDARYAKEPIRKMSKMLEKLGMPRDGSHVFHCLRHNMNDGLARVPSDALPLADEVLKKFIRYSVMGHKPGDDVNVLHYTHTSLKEKAALVAALVYELPDIVKLDINYAIESVGLALGNKIGSRYGLEDMGPLNDD